jgi:hypothetical protein
MREIVIDAETSGLDPLDGYRLAGQRTCANHGQVVVRGRRRRDGARLPQVARRRFQDFSWPEA